MVSKRTANVRSVCRRIVSFAAALDRKKRPLSVLGVLFEEAGHQLKVGSAEVLCVEFGCTGTPWQ